MPPKNDETFSEKCRKIFTKFNRPIVIFDVETTGMVPKTDRVIQLGLLQLPSFEAIELLLNPLIPIPPEVAGIHGISDEAIATASKFFEVAPLLSRIMLQQCPILCGFNVRAFDVLVLKEEFARVGIEFPVQGQPIVDSCELFYRKEPRDLTGALKFYCGEELDGAHSAMVDVIGTVKVLSAQLDRYEDLPSDPHEFDKFTRKPRKPNYIDDEGKFQWFHGVATVMFGNKHKGKSIRDVYRQDRGFFDWMLNSEFKDDTKDIAREAKQGRFPEKNSPSQ